MGWTETCAVEERMRFVIAAEKHEETRFGPWLPERNRIFCDQES